MKNLFLLIVLSLSAIAQDVPRNPALAPTIANFSLRAADTVITCHQLNQGWRERLAPVHSCGGIIAWNSGMAGGSYFADRWLIRHGHSRLAQFQWASAGGSAWGIVYTFK